MIFFLSACAGKEKPVDNGAFAREAPQAESHFDYERIQASGELIVVTLTGPETYFEYHGRGMGMQYALAENFAKHAGLRLRVETVRDTTALRRLLSSTDADVAMLQLPLSYIRTAGFRAAGARDTARHTSWAVKATSEDLAQALDRWYTAGINVSVAKEEKARMKERRQVRRKVRAPYISREKGLISTYDDHFRAAARLTGWDWRLIAAQCYQESGFDPACRQGGGGPGRGFFQWEEGGSRFAALSTLAASRGVSWEDAACQMDFFWSEADGVFRTYSVMDHVYDTGAHAGLGGYMSFAMWQQIRDIDWATESFERVYTRASRPAMERRIEYARSYLSILEADPSLSQDYASASTAQKAIVDACRQTPSPGGNLCAKWVSQVFDRAGIGYIGGNACDMYDRWCNMSGGSQLKVGMIVAVDSYDLGGSSSAAVAGRIYGHVAIYVGDGQVMENVGSIRTTPLDRWLETYGNVHPVKWGWAMGVDLSQEG